MDGFIPDRVDGAERFVRLDELADRLDEVIGWAATGLDVVILRDGQRPLKLGPAWPNRRFGALRGVLPPIPDDAFAPLSDEELAEWEDGEV